MTPSSDTVWVATHRHLILLAGLIVLQVVQPLLAHGSVLNRVLYDAAFGAVMVLVSFAIFTRRRDRWIAVALMAPAIGANIAHYALPQSSQWLAATVFHGLSAAFLGFAVVVVLARILRQRTVSGDDVLGAIAGWVLMGLIWGHLFALTDRLFPDSFTISPAIAGELREWQSRRALFDYFSFTTLTSLGYGDITPTRAPAYTLAWLEVMFGGFYMAVIVAQLVGLKLARAQDREHR
jgi:general stress protein CsbA